MLGPPLTASSVYLSEFLQVLRENAAKVPCSRRLAHNINRSRPPTIGFRLFDSADRFGLQGVRQGTLRSGATSSQPIENSKFVKSDKKPVPHALEVYVQEYDG